MAISAPAAVAQPPSRAAALRGLIQGYWLTQAMYVACKLGIADVLKDGPHHPNALAQATGAHPGALTRLLRLLAGQEVFAEDADGLLPLLRPPPYFKASLPSYIVFLGAQPAA